ncbi:Hsp70 family protein [Actinokineospora enzanensis]|uniref:Hsp70 family protein n=1 Tax=Actinokineospora enzanensis TaxID=155975 RepID=UPI00037528F7|nr:Hsp70 family protein [Actinokineospora enzanensis]
MPYVLGVDIGRTRGVAAVRRRLPGGGFDAPEIGRLDGGTRWVSSVLVLAGDGEVLVGQAAERAAAEHPDRVARSVVDRVGDDTAVLLGGELYPAENLLAALVAWIVDTVADAEGEQPERLALTHPPDWGPYRRGLLHDALTAAGLPGVVLVPTVVAAAEAYQDTAPLAAGSTIVVTLLGGHRVEHAVLRRTQNAFELVGQHVTTDAGAALDDALARYVLAHVAAHPGPTDHTVPDIRATRSMAPFRAACVTAKERLSVATEVRVPVPHLGTDVAVTRARFDELAHPLLAPAITATRALLARAPADTVAVLAGGTARVPLVAALSDCAVLDDPGGAAARGAALAISPRPELRRIGSGNAVAVPDPESDPHLPRVPVLPAALSTVDVPDEPPPRPPVHVTPPRQPSGRFPRPRRPRHDEDEDPR